jgi:hypothetical protein
MALDARFLFTSSLSYHWVRLVAAGPGGADRKNSLIRQVHQDSPTNHPVRFAAALWGLEFVW